jgi:hypothetical protein
MEAQMLHTVAGALIGVVERIGVTHIGAALVVAGQTKLTGRLGVCCGTTRALALGIMLTSPVAAYADESLSVPNVVEDLLFGSDHSQRAYHERLDSASRGPFKPRTINGLSRNPDACASYGCVDN